MGPVALSSDAWDVVVVGGGPAGMAATIEARRSDARVLLMDNRPQLGGQVFKRMSSAYRLTKRESEVFGSEYVSGSKLIAETEASGASIIHRATVWEVRGTEILAARDAEPGGGGGSTLAASAKAVVLASGAYDRPAPMPGWTLPGVITSGGLQTLVKTQGVLPGRRIVFSGSGPLSLAFPAQVARLGGNVGMVLEASSFPTMASIASLIASARGSVGVLRTGLGYYRYLKRHHVPLRWGYGVVRVHGSEHVEGVTVARLDPDWHVVAGTEQDVECDTVCFGFGFQPSIELANLSGCAVAYDEDRGGYYPMRDALCRSSISGIFVAGDGAGTGGSAIAVTEGRIAGIAASHDVGLISQAEMAKRLRPLMRRLSRLRRFRCALDRLYPWGVGLYGRPSADTVICRCEEVTAAEIRRACDEQGSSLNSVKGATRAGMGLCQGRNCSRQIAVMLSETRHVGVAEVGMFTPRSPAVPVRVGALTRLGGSAEE